jgi:hypothetical protein
MGEVLRFFDEHLAGNGYGAPARVPRALLRHAWGGMARGRELACRPGHALPQLASENRAFGSDSAPGRGCLPGRLQYRHGAETRYERIAGIDSQNYYFDWQGRDERMLSYTSEPLEAPIELAGHAVLSLWLSSASRMRHLFAYLSEVEADGQRPLRHRGAAPGAAPERRRPVPDYHRTAWPYRSFAKADAEPMPVDIPQLLRFALLPVGWRFEAGSRIRLSISGADSDHSGQVPHGRPPG